MVKGMAKKARHARAQEALEKVAPLALLIIVSLLSSPAASGSGRCAGRW